MKFYVLLFILLLTGFSVNCKSIEALGIDKDVVNIIREYVKASRDFCDQPVRQIDYCPNKKASNTSTCYRVSYDKGKTISRYIEVTIWSSGDIKASPEKVILEDGEILTITSGRRCKIKSKNQR